VAAVKRKQTPEESLGFEVLAHEYFLLLGRRRSGRRFRTRDPELVLTYARLFQAMTDAERLHQRKSLRPPALKQLTELLRAGSDVDGEAATIDLAAEMADSIEQILVRTGDPDFLFAGLGLERQADRLTDRSGQPAAMVRWSDLFSIEDLDRLIQNRAKLYPGARGGDDWSREASAKLETLLLARSRAYRLQRARTRLRNRYLVGLAPVILLLTAGLAYGIQATNPGLTWKVTMLAAFAGALGATISGVYKLRDHIRRIGQLRAFWASTIVQPLVGASAGLVVLLALESSLFQTDAAGASTSPATKGLLAFAAGFSEPFFLGVVGRLADLGERSARTEGKRADTEPPPAAPFAS